MMNKISLISAIFLSSVMVSNADLNWHDTSVSASEGKDFSNPVFDVFFLGDEIVYLGSKTEQEKIPAGKLDPNIRSGEAWDTKYDEEMIKSAVMDGINYWTDTITNRLDSNQQKLKIAVAFGVQKQFANVNGFANYITIDARKTRDSVAGYNEEIQANGNYRTVIEASLRDNDITFRSDNSSKDLNINANAGCIDIFLGFNLAEIATSANTSEKDFAKMISATVTHELGHAMGLSTQLYKGVCDKVDNDGFWVGTQNCVPNAADMTKLDTLLCLKDTDGNLIRLAQIIDGNVVLANEFNGKSVDLTLADSLASLGNGRLVISELGETKDNGDNTLTVYNTQGEANFVEGRSIEHLFILDQDGYQHDILGTYSSTLEFGENDLKLIKMLGYGLATIPEPSTVSLFAGCCAFALVGIRRRKNNVG